MSTRFYILPLEIVPDNGRNRRRPKHVASTAYSWSLIDYGAENICVIGVTDPTDADHAVWAADPEVLALPLDLNVNLTASEVTQIEAFLEGVNIPADWLSAGITYRQMIKKILSLFQFLQRWNGITRGNSPFKEGFNLASINGLMNAAARQRVNACFDTLKIRRQGVTGASSLRETMHTFADRFPPIKFAGETF